MEYEEVKCVNYALQCTRRRTETNEIKARKKMKEAMQSRNQEHLRILVALRSGLPPKDSNRVNNTENRRDSNFNIHLNNVLVKRAGSKGLGTFSLENKET